MILLTVGNQLPFDRLVQAIDELAPGLDGPVIAQIGLSGIRPQNMVGFERLPQPEFEDHCAKARLIVAHAGIGSVLAARRHRKPIVLLPRRAALGEHRSDHQVATVRQLSGRPGIWIAMNTHELPARIDQALAAGFSDAGQTQSLNDLSNAVTHFIRTGNLPDA